MNAHFPILARIMRAVFNRRNGRGLLVLIVLAVVVHAIFLVRNGRMLEAQLRTIRESGAPVTMADMGKPVVPPERNGAPLFLQAFETLKRAVPRGETSPPSIGRLVDAPDPTADRALIASARKELALAAPAMELADRASRYPQWQFPVDWAAGAGAVYPHLAQMRHLERVVCAQALIAAMDGDKAQAVRSLELAYRMAIVPSQERTVIAQLVCYSLYRSASAATCEVLSIMKLPPAFERALAERLVTVNITPPLVRAMEGERAFQIWAYDYILSDSYGSLIYMSEGEDAPPAPVATFFSRLLLWEWRPLLYADECYDLRLMETVVDDAALPYRESHYAKHGAGEFPPEPPWWAFVARIAQPVFGRSQAVRDEAQAHLALACAGLGLQACRQQYGQYPDSLADLRARLGWKVPPDPFTGKDLIYRRQGRGYLLYSIGADLKDNQGRPRVRGSRSSRAPYDIVWRMAK